MCAGSCGALYGHVPDEQSRRRQRHAPLAGSTTSPRRARAGYDPTLFGYTDQGLDPNQAEGFRRSATQLLRRHPARFLGGLYLPESQAGWIQYLRAKGYDVRDRLGAGPAR